MLHVIALLALGAEPAYKKPDLLIGATDLMKAIGKYHVLDVRGMAAFEKGHVPGSQPIDGNAWAAAFQKGQDVKEWTITFDHWSVPTDRTIVVVGTPRSPDAFRMWWILKYWGIEDVRVLDGGYPAWAKAGGKKETNHVAPGKVKPVLKPQADRLATKAQILKGLEKKNFPQIIDARTEGEHCGTTKSAKRGGAIPGARHLNWIDTVDADGRIKPAGKLADLFKDAGIDPSKPAATYCQGGGRAAEMAFVVELLTGKPARNYYKSWGEWGNDAEVPVVVPKKK